VKLAAPRTNRALGFLPNAAVCRAVERACQELLSGGLAADIVVDALQGGAGTSTNMNVNEVLANRSLELLDKPRGTYDVVSPDGHAQPAPEHERHLSDGAAHRRDLGAARPRTRSRRAAGVLPGQGTGGLRTSSRLAAPEYQDAVLTTLGREMGAYADALSRDSLAA